MKKPSNPKTGKKEHNHYRWALTAFVMAVALSGLLSLSSEAILENAGLLLALLILALFIGLGILFDIIGVAVTAADPRPFHSMAAHKEKGAKEALKLLRNADRVQRRGGRYLRHRLRRYRRGDRGPAAKGTGPGKRADLRGCHGADLRRYHRRKSAGKALRHEPEQAGGPSGRPVSAFVSSRLSLC